MAVRASGRVKRESELYQTPKEEVLRQVPEEPPLGLQVLKQTVETSSVGSHDLRTRFLDLPPAALESPRADDGRDAIGRFYTAADEPVTQAMVDRLANAYVVLDEVVTELERYRPAPQPSGSGRETANPRVLRMMHDWPHGAPPPVTGCPGGARGPGAAGDQSSSLPPPVSSTPPDEPSDGGRAAPPGQTADGSSGSASGAGEAEPPGPELPEPDAGCPGPGKPAARP